MNPSPTEGPEAVLEYWFGTAIDANAIAASQAKLWWGKDGATDREIRERFLPLRRAAIDGRLAAWTASPRGRLALIVLIDQFSRNIFRDSPEAFAHDDLARRWCTDGLAQGDDRRLRPIERVFFYLPLEHSESIADQARSVALFTALRDEAPDAERGLFEGYLDFARRHRDIVDRFGRFPHRNAVLARGSTKEEVEFLRGPGSSF
jgi:uncharacterized protein (DUF924 family)